MAKRASLLERLRSSAARAVWGGEKSLCVRLAMASGYAGLQDAEVYLLQQALTKMQRLLQIWPELGRDALDIARNFQHERGRPYGPATSLSRLLARNDWQLRLSTLLKGPGLLRIDLGHHTAKHIRQTLALAFNAKVPSLVAHRQGLRVMPEPDLTAFHSVCRALGPAAVRGLAKVFFGGYHSKAAQVLRTRFKNPHAASVANWTQKFTANSTAQHMRMSDNLSRQSLIGWQKRLLIGPFAHFPACTRM